jgi:cellulose biosynthesis protein BcsQ
VSTLAVYSNKGGVGKTTTAVNLAYLAARSGLSTLICDLDPQGAATYYFRVRPKLKPKARRFLRGGRAVDRSIKGTDYELLDLLPSDFTHRELDVAFASARHRRRRLDKVLAPLREEYDFIVLDCPPTINLVAENVFRSADSLLVPLIPTVLSVRAYEQVRAFLKREVWKSVGVWSFFSMVIEGNELHREVMQTVPARYEGFLDSAIPYMPLIERMGVYREPVSAHSPDSEADLAYRALWSDVRTRVMGLI